jgi:hypothetical protein
MKYDACIDKISDWVKLNIEINSQNHEEILEIIDSSIPNGWGSLPALMMGYMEDVGLVLVTKLAIEKGLLRMSCVARGYHMEQTFDVLAHHAAMKSSVTCLVCGNRGYRRTTLEGWPSLCTMHHVQYVNFLDEVNNGNTEEDL